MLGICSKITRNSPHMLIHFLPNEPPFREWRNAFQMMAHWTTGPLVWMKRFTTNLQGKVYCQSGLALLCIYSVIQCSVRLFNPRRQKEEEKYLFCLSNSFCCTGLDQYKLVPRQYSKLFPLASPQQPCCRFRSFHLHCWQYNSTYSSTLCEEVNKTFTVGPVTAIRCPNRADNSLHLRNHQNFLMKRRSLLLQTPGHCPKMVQTTERERKQAQMCCSLQIFL